MSKKEQRARAGENAKTVGDTFDMSGNFQQSDIYIKSPVTNITQTTDPYDVHGLANPYLGLRSFTYTDHKMVLSGC